MKGCQQLDGYIAELHLASTAQQLVHMIRVLQKLYSVACVPCTWSAECVLLCQTQSSTYA